jgi:hypothetical protein
MLTSYRIAILKIPTTWPYSNSHKPDEIYSCIHRLILKCIYRAKTVATLFYKPREISSVAIILKRPRPIYMLQW